MWLYYDSSCLATEQKDAQFLGKPDRDEHIPDRLLGKQLIEDSEAGHVGADC